MSAWLSKDPERSPLLRRPPVQRVVSSGGPTPEELARCDVFNTILLIRQDIIEHIDSPVGWAKMQEPEINYGIVRPLTDKYVALDNLAIVYCLLANRLQFIDDSNQLPQARLNLARAHLCELLAIRVLNHYAKATEPLQHPHMSHHHPTSLNPLPHGSANHTHGGPSTFPRTNTAGTTGMTGTVGTVGTAGTASTRPSTHDRRRSLAVEGARQRRMSMAEPKITRMARKRADELRLANVLIAGFHPFAGAPAEVLEEEEMEGRTDRGKACNALELAIVTEAKHFIGSVSCQKVVGESLEFLHHSVWSGRIYYTPVSFFDLIPDHCYKQKSITLYDSRKAPLLDHYRLRVPRYRSILEFTAFLVVFTLMMLVLYINEAERMNGWEIAFAIYTCGWTLDRFATTLEHGWRVFAANLWNGLDAVIILLFLFYLPFRLYGVIHGHSAANDYALSILACESALIFPRLAFFFMAKNVLVMSLRAMLGQFLILMIAAIWIFIGFWHALYKLDEGNYGVWEIAKYMADIWFGLDATGFNISTDFHPTLGPALFFIFACLSNTLFITVVVSILSTTFAELNQDAKAEFMYRSAVGIFEGVKSDALFSFQPPLNLLALFTLFPLSRTLSPRAFHRTHVFFTRLTNGPVLLLITLFERLRHSYALSQPNFYERFQRALPKRMQEVSLFMSGAHGDIEAVFDYAPDAKLLADAAAQDAAYDEDSRDGMGLSSSISLAAGTGGVGGVGGPGGHRVSGWYNVRRMSEYQDTAVAEEPEESDIEEEDEDQVAAAEETEGVGGDKHSVASSQAGNSNVSVSVNASTPTPKPLGIPKLHPQPETVVTEGILSTSPGQHVRRMQAIGKPLQTRFDTRRRDSVSSIFRPQVGGPPEDSSGGGSPLQRIYSRGSEDRRRSFSREREIDPLQLESDVEPAWARALLEAVKRLEERQAKLDDGARTK